VEKHDEEAKLTEYGQKWLKDRLETAMKEYLYKRITDGYKQFGEFLSFLKNKQ
jgi:hypothetical protein